LVSTSFLLAFDLLFAFFLSICLSFFRSFCLLSVLLVFFLSGYFQFTFFAYWMSLDRHGW